MSEKEPLDKRIPTSGDSSPIEPPVDLDDEVELLPGVYHLPYIRQLLKVPYSQEGVVVEIPDVTRNEPLVKGVAKPPERLRYSQDPADVDGPEDLSTNSRGNSERRSAKTFGYLEEDESDDPERLGDIVVGSSSGGELHKIYVGRRGTNRRSFSEDAMRDFKPEN